MAPRSGRRVLALVIVAALLAMVAGALYHRLAGVDTPEERAREKAEQLRERVHDLTHGK